MHLRHEHITRQIIGAAFEVHRVLGYGFLEKVYQRAMQVELQQQGLQAELEAPVQVRYKGTAVGHYQADLLVQQKVIVELKVARQYNPHDEAQILNELKATGLEVGMLINFGMRKMEFRRFVLSDLPVYDPCESKPAQPEPDLPT